MGMFLTYYCTKQGKTCQIRIFPDKIFTPIVLVWSFFKETITWIELVTSDTQQCSAASTGSPNMHF